MSKGLIIGKIVNLNDGSRAVVSLPTPAAKGVQRLIRAARAYKRTKSDAAITELLAAAQAIDGGEHEPR